jgi:glycerol kinase
MAEVTALGCALAAGLGVGAIEDEDALRQLHKEHKTYQIYDSSVGSHPISNAQAISFVDFFGRISYL